MTASDIIAALFFIPLFYALFSIPGISLAFAGFWIFRRLRGWPRTLIRAGLISVAIAPGGMIHTGILIPALLVAATWEGLRALLLVWLLAIPLVAYAQARTARRNSDTIPAPTTVDEELRQ